MSDLIWVSSGFTLVYGAIAGYASVLEWRRLRAAHRAEEVER